MGYTPLEACLIIFAGAVAALLAARLLRLDRAVARWAAPRVAPPHQVIADLLIFADAARAVGFSPAAASLRSGCRLFADSARLAADTTDAARLRPRLQAHVDRSLRRSGSSLGRWARTFISITGFGALCGAVFLMLRAADDPTSISAGVAVCTLALVAAGAVFHQLAQPVTPGVPHRHAQELLAGAILIEGILAIHAGATPGQVRERIAALLPPNFVGGATLRQAA